MPRRSGSHGIWHTKRANGTHREHKGTGGGRRSRTQQPARGEPSSSSSSTATAAQKDAQPSGKTTKTPSGYVKKQARQRGTQQ